MSRWLIIFLAATGVAFGDSTINDPQKFVWAANAGWVNLRPSTTSGLNVGEFFCAGYGYAANLGWINFGNGTPPNGIQYGNVSSNDFGVNLQAGGALRGQAWGANVGWIQFESVGNPRVDYATGQLRGYAWGANLGWINLGEITSYAKTDVIQSGADSDGDGIPDAWERQRTGNLTALGNADSDGDGVSDRNEYLADTNPTNAASQFQLTMSPPLNPLGTQLELSWPASAARSYGIEARPLVDSGSWSNVSSGVLNGSNGIQTQVITPDGTTRFYRLGVYLPLQP